MCEYRLRLGIRGSGLSSSSFLLDLEERGLGVEGFELAMV